MNIRDNHVYLFFYMKIIIRDTIRYTQKVHSASNFSISLVSISETFPALIFDFAKKKKET